MNDDLTKIAQTCLDGAENNTNDLSRNCRDADAGRL
jgi:hypothetical protein